MAVASGFQAEVERMNQGIRAQLAEIIREETEEKERVEAIRLKIELKEKKIEEDKERRRLIKINGQPFKFATVHRAKHRSPIRQKRLEENWMPSSIMTPSRP